MLEKRQKQRLQIEMPACKLKMITISNHILTLSRFCGEDEEHDPSEEYEEYLSCAVCGDNGKFICASA